MGETQDALPKYPGKRVRQLRYGFGYIQEVQLYITVLCYNNLSLMPSQLEEFFF